MTIISRTHRFIFIHVPKTAGTSIKEHFAAVWNADEKHILPTRSAQTGLGIDGFKKHSTAIEVRDILGSEFSDFFTFSVVRNPFIRTVSLFRFLKFTFVSWPRARRMEKFKTLEHFVQSSFFRTSGPGGILAPQISWLYDKSGTRCVDFLAHVETINQDVDWIEKRLGLPRECKSLQKLNQSKGDLTTFSDELISSKISDAIIARYRSDFQIFGYSTDPVDAMKSLTLDILTRG